MVLQTATRYPKLIEAMTPRLIIDFKDPPKILTRASHYERPKTDIGIPPSFITPHHTWSSMWIIHLQLSISDMIWRIIEIRYPISDIIGNFDN